MTRTTSTSAVRALALIISLLVLGLASPGQASPHPFEGMLPGGRMASGAAGVELLSAGGFYTCAIKPDGTLVCWGRNVEGQLNAPTGTFTAISAGHFHTCALKTDGTLACWGRSLEGQLNNIPVGTFTTVSAGRSHTCALKTDGTLACWGDNSLGQTAAPTDTFTALSAGDFHTCALKTDGSLACWGNNDVDQLNNIPTGTFTAVSAGNFHTCALKTDGTLACWGNNSDGQVNAPTGTFTAFSAGIDHTCALKTNGSLICWGNNVLGQINAPTGTFTALSAGRFHTCALKTDGTLVCWGGNSDGQLNNIPAGSFSRRTLAAMAFHTCEIRPGDTLACWGDNHFGIRNNIPTGIFTALSGGATNACALKTDGTLVCWGDNSDGQSTPPAGTFTAFSAGSFHTCALKTDGTLACWGNNDSGQLNAPAGTFSAVSSSLADNSGANHTCAIKTDGTLACWGNNFFGQSTPPAGTFTAIGAGNRHTCALKTDSTLTCWGNNSLGQLNVPSGIFTALSAGFSHTCAIKPDGTLACWGDNGSGQLNFPTGTFTAISAGAIHNCALKTDGILVCWGDNRFGQAPQPSLSPASLPNGLFGSPYSQALSLTANLYTPPSPVFSLTGSLPTGLSFLTNTLAGTPTLAGSFPLTAQAVDANGFAATQAYTLLINDNTPPVITPVITGTLGNNGWYTSNVTVTWTVVDNESPVSSQLNCSPTTITADTGGTTLTCQATSLGGTTSQSVTIKRDTVAPTVSSAVTTGTLGNNSWYVSDVTVTTTGTDDVSGIASCSADQTLNSDTASTSLAGSCTDNAGHSTDSAALTLKRDATPPTLTPVVMPNPVPFNGAALADASADDALSGLASASCGAPDTSAAGDRTVPCAATDLAGNTASANATYTVLPEVSNTPVISPVPVIGGSPVVGSTPDVNGIPFGIVSTTIANPPQLNRVKAGDRVPFVWKVTDAHGLPVTNLKGATLAVEPIDCPAEPGHRVKKAKNASGRLGFLNLGKGKYLYNWKTRRGYANTCKAVSLSLKGVSGQERVGLFRFTRK
jgi:alpha-tubulin suppressor-like RCC1 family protein